MVLKFAWRSAACSEVLKPETVLTCIPDIIQECEEPVLSDDLSKGDDASTNIRDITYKDV